MANPRHHRRARFILLVLAVAGAAFVGWRALGPTPAQNAQDEPPFRFLTGRRPIKNRSVVTAEARRAAQENAFVTFSFEADFDDLLDAAKKELLPLGYHLDLHQGEMPFQTGTKHAWFTGPLGEDIRIQRDAHTADLSTRGFALKSTQRTGWVTVTLHRIPHKP